MADLIGKPYRFNGRGPDGYDCAGLVVEVLRRIGHTFDVPETFGDYSNDVRSMRQILGGSWMLSGPEPGAVAFFRSEAHVGILIDRRRILHTSILLQEATVESLDSPYLVGKRPLFYLPESAG